MMDSKSSVASRSLGPKKIRSVASGIIRQINVKLGNSLWNVMCASVLPNKNVMLIGADVYHNTQNNKQSVVAICASFDPASSKYYTRIKIQNKGEEVMKNISCLVEDCLKHYNKKNKLLPDTIIFYRDGVGDSQCDWVTEIEIPGIFDCFKRFSPDYNPKFCEILVNKRIHQRFFSFHKDGKSYLNPPSGTWISDTVVSKTNYDFFLCAQNVTQGTTTPTHYTFVYDSLKLPEDKLAALTYYQCFNYFNWTGAIRVPVCAQYAHKAAYLVGESLGKEFHPDLRHLMIYL